MEVELAPADAKGVSGGARLDPALPKRSTEADDPDLERLTRRIVGSLSPHLVDQPVCGHDPSGFEQKVRKHRPLARPTDRYRCAVVADDLERPEDGELHLTTVVRP